MPGVYTKQFFEYICSVEMSRWYANDSYSTCNTEERFVSTSLLPKTNTTSAFSWIISGSYYFLVFRLFDDKYYTWANWGSLRVVFVFYLVFCEMITNNFVDDENKFFNQFAIKNVNQKRMSNT